MGFLRILYKIMGSVVLYICLISVSAYSEDTNSIQAGLKPEEEALTKANTLYQEGKKEEAIVAYESFLKTYGQEVKGAVKVHYIRGQWYEENGMCEKAKECYQYAAHGSVNEQEYVILARQRLGDLNKKLLFSCSPSSLQQGYEVKPHDTLAKIATMFHTTVALIMRINGLEDALIRPGMKLAVPKGAFTLFVDKSENMLYVQCAGDFFKCYKISTGKNKCTPVGTFTIVNKIENPIWYKDGFAIPPGTPENMLGTRWLGFSCKGYGIHGTLTPDTIGAYETAGCVRMKNEEVEELYPLLPLGTQVTIVEKA